MTAATLADPVAEVVVCPAGVPWCKDHQTSTDGDETHRTWVVEVGGYEMVSDKPTTVEAQGEQFCDIDGSVSTVVWLRHGDTIIELSPADAYRFANAVSAAAFNVAPNAVPVPMGCDGL